MCSSLLGPLFFSLILFLPLFPAFFFFFSLTYFPLHVSLHFDRLSFFVFSPSPSLILTNHFIESSLLYRWCKASTRKLLREEQIREARGLTGRVGTGFQKVRCRISWREGEVMKGRWIKNRAWNSMWVEVSLATGKTRTEGQCERLAGAGVVWVLSEGGCEWRNEAKGRIHQQKVGHPNANPHGFSIHRHMTCQRFALSSCAPHF